MLRIVACLLLAAALPANGLVGGLRVSRRDADGEVEYVYAKPGETVDFSCNYNESFDTYSERGMGFDVTDCSVDTLPYDLEGMRFTLPVAVIGKSAEMFLPGLIGNSNLKPPVFYKNGRDDKINNGDIQVTEPGINKFTVRVKVNSSDNNRCLTCAQASPSLELRVTTRRRIQLISPPTANLTVYSPKKQVDDKGRHLVVENSTLTVICKANSKGGTVKAIVMSGDQLLQQNDTQPNPIIRYVIEKVSNKISGEYTCLAESTYEDSIGEKVARANQTDNVIVMFAPKFPAQELLYYAKSGEEKDVQLVIVGYPVPQLNCNQSANQNLQESVSYTESDFSGTYRVTLSNIENVHNETNVTCTATNSIGSRTALIQLTARAPKPTITSNGGDVNGKYRLEWQHHMDGDVEYYNINIVYNNDEKKSSSIKYNANETSELVNDPRQELNGENVVHSVELSGVIAGKQHRVKVQACNKHGCSEYSKPVNFMVLSNDDGKPKAATAISASFKVTIFVCLIAILDDLN